MTHATQILIFLIGLLHLGFMILEMFLWTKPAGRKVFRLEPVFAEQSKALAANQGLYNGFLAVGIFWSVLGSAADSRSLQFFFLGCVIVAGLYGGYSVNKRIVIVQAVPAILAFLLLLCF